MTSLLGWLGAVALLFGLLSLILQLFSGFVFTGIDLPWILANFGIGVLLLVVALVANLEKIRERMRTGEARRAGKYGTSAVLGTVLAIALLGLLAFLSTRYHTRWDWTEASSHSLTDQTQKVLDSLEDDVSVTAFYSAIAAPAARDVLDRYAYRSDRFQVAYVDPQARPGLVESLGVTTEKLTGGLVHIQLGEESVEVDELTEERLTNALVKLTRRDKKKVYFLEGHGERPIDGDGSDGEGGFAFARESLENENYEVETILLAAQGGVPEDADVLIAAGPTRPFFPTEVEALRAWVAGGGALLVLVDPGSETELSGLVAEWGVTLGNDVIVDRVQGLFGRPVSPFAAEYAPHPITEGLREATLFHMARSVQPSPEAAAAFTVLVRTSAESWGETNLEAFQTEGRAELDDADLAGPVPVAVAGSLAAEPGAADAAAEPGRLVVIGDSDFATNPLLRQFRNRDLFVNMVNWLLGDVEAISVRPDSARASRLQLTRSQFSQIRYLSLFVLPEAIAILGVFVWWSRRQAAAR
jgi:ABC-type uncharacterized transport system involved in gliding motility auxiliary subunit